jgi:hypothetical protein
MNTAHFDALKLAEKWFEENAYNEEAIKVHQAIKKALEQPSRKPTAYLYVNCQAPFYQCLEFKSNEILGYTKGRYARFPLFLGVVSEEEHHTVREAAMRTGQNV